MYTRSVLRLGSHQYVVVHDGVGNEWTIEGEPQSFKWFHWGYLVSSVIENGYGQDDNPNRDTVFGGDWIIPCSEVPDLVSTARGFNNGTALYSPLGPNSNSYMHWFLVQTGLSFYYPLPPPGAMGWYDPIPGN
jgi:hypothetical protein